jgi:hypothetical protein
METTQNRKTASRKMFRSKIENVRRSFEGYATILEARGMGA